MSDVYYESPDLEIDAEINKIKQQQAVARYTAARNAINGAQPEDLPLLKALENVFFSPSLTRCLQEEALDHDLCLQLLEDVQKDVRLLTAQREWR